MKLKPQYTVKVTTVATGKVKEVTFTKEEILKGFEGINSEIKFANLLSQCFQEPNQKWEFVY
jgi:hypothetical protein